MNEATEVLPRQAPQIKFSESDKERFWSKVKKSDDGCWTWTAAKDKDGYGLFWLNQAMVRAHRLSLLTKIDPNGETDYNSLFACHKCDNPSCVNPDHIYFGSHTDNIADMVNRGRGLSGERSPATSLTEKDVTQIRIMYFNGNTTSRKLAKQFGVGKSTILRIIHHKTWKYFKPDCTPPPGVKNPTTSPSSRNSSAGVNHLQK
jgi:hypothetical protein